MIYDLSFNGLDMFIEYFGEVYVNLNFALIIGYLSALLLVAVFMLFSLFDLEMIPRIKAFFRKFKRKKIGYEPCDSISYHV